MRAEEPQIVNHGAPRVAFYRTAHALSNFHQTVFEMDGHLFSTAEHGLVFCKAMLFGDTEIANEILSSITPGAAKALGRKIANFDDTVWKAHREQVMEKVLYAKFDQGKKVREQLMSYPLDAEFIEASPAIASGGSDAPRGTSRRAFRCAASTFSGSASAASRLGCTRSAASASEVQVRTRGDRQS